ncbi:hypothetical protein C8Q79DRAFT_924738 [Trametes meyenii]|nr:hypothetical protein C8Q79DRAFT_924738 [Trametes meyenii]
MPSELLNGISRGSIKLTCVLYNAALLEGFGATNVLDRNLSATALRAEVVRIAGGLVSAVYDAISLPETQSAAFDLLAPGGKLLTVLAPHEPKEDPEGRTVQSISGIIQLPQNAEFGKTLYAKLTELLEAGDIKPLVVEVIPGGLGGITTGLAKLKNDQVSATKLVVRPGETA